MNTSWNHGHKGNAENGWAGSHLMPMILQWPPKKKGPKDRRGQEFRVHTYPTVSSRPRGRCVQSFVQFGLEMWICISFIHTYKQTNIYLYIQGKWNVLLTVQGYWQYLGMSGMCYWLYWVIVSIWGWVQCVTDWNMLLTVLGYWQYSVAECIWVTEWTILLTGLDY